MGTRKRGRPVGELGRQSVTLSLRVRPDMRVALEQAAKTNTRSLNAEIVLRLLSTLSRDHEERPPHIRALSEIVERAALGIERVTERQFNEDRYTAEQVVKAVDLLLWQYSPKTGAVIRPGVVAAMKPRGSDPSQLGVIEAGAVIAQVESVAEPPVREMPVGAYYPESWWSLWQARKNLKPRRRK